MTVASSVDPSTRRRRSCDQRRKSRQQETFDFVKSDVAATAPEVHGHHRTRNPDLTAVTYVVFPAFATEVSGRESVEEA